MSYENICFATEGNIALITLNRPQRRNALSLALMQELIDCLERDRRRRDLRAVILAAAGKVFSSGHDLSEMVGRDENEYQRIFDVCTELMAKLQSIPQPVIAEVQGIATAAGCQLVATCDLAIAAEEAAFATPGVRIGLFCTTPMVALSRAIGRKRALEMLLTGEPIDAHTAADWGLVNRVVAAGQLRRRDAQTCWPHRRSERSGGGSGQAGLLYADRSRSAESLRLRPGGDEHERASARRAGRHLGVP